MNNTYDASVYGAGTLSINATQFTNIGNISGNADTAEIFGKFWSDGGSTLTTYTILGSITVNGETLEGDYSVGANTNLTLSDRVLPEGSEETEE